MKRFVVATVGFVVGVGLLWGCASMQTWPASERSAENKMALIQEEIGDGLKTGALTPDQSQSFLTKLKVIRTDFEGLSDRTVYRDQWDSLLGRLDALGADVSRAVARGPRIEEPRNGDRIVALQRRIDDARINRRWPLTDLRGFQARLDVIRSDYFRMTEGGRSTTREERTDISRRLDVLETDMDRVR